MEIISIIVLMGVVTYLPRLVPMYLIDVEKIPGRLKLFLSFIPYAALGALILPGSISAVSGKPVVSALGIASAVIIAWFNSNIIITVLLTVLATFLFISAGL
ncbi:MAG TPA: AzlD domain-containing protein [Spirochaetota bacterium]|nr:AzlD domain-containing protein [Spirochaetota bacterium]HPJ33210.1 AzlD domain-containing protein [Spirochaetota bacterium]